MKKTLLNVSEIEALHRAGRLAEAKHGYLALLKENPKEIKALHLLAILFAEEGDLASAQHYLEEAIAKEAHDPVLYLHLANILKAKNLFSDAEKVLLTLTEKHPHFAAAFNNLGTIFFAEGKYSEAISAYEKAIAIQANYTDAYYNLGLALAKAKYYEKAINTYLALIELAPQHPGAHFQLACLRMERNQLDAAIKHFSIVAKDHPFHFETQSNLATCYLKLGKLDVAQIHYENALEIMPKDLQILFNLGIINVQQGKIDQAIACYLRVVDIDPSFYDAHHNLGFIFLAKNEIVLALKHFRQALQLRPTNVALEHTINIITREKKMSSSPPEYIQALFDSYADHFDAHLKESLHYQVPRLIYQAVNAVLDLKSANLDILDLGCGTGLCGELFKKVARRLVGVDLSPKMLELAREKNIYDTLSETDVLTFLQDKDACYDLVIGGDVLVYFGDLQAVFPAVAKALKPGGLFVFDAEVGGEDYVMTASGRFAHSKSYLEKLAKQSQFTVSSYDEVVLRTQNHQPVSGHLYVLRRSQS